MKKVAAEEQDALVKETIDNIAKSDKYLSAIAKRFKDIVNKGYDGYTIPIMRIHSSIEESRRVVKIVIVSIMMVSIDKRRAEEINRLKSMKKDMLE